MILLKDITFDIIPFTNEITNITMVLVSELLLGIIIDILIIYSFLKQRDLPIDSQFILSLTIADFLFCAVFLVSHIFNAVRSGWATGQVGCLFTAIALIYTLGMSILSITGMTLHRYLIVIHQFHLTQKQVYIILSVLWCGLASVIAGFVSSKDLREYGIGLTSGMGYCMIVFARQETLNIIAGSAVLAFILIPMTFLVFAYYRIVATYSKLLAGKKMKQSVKTIQENRLVKKAVAITGSFMFCMFSLLAVLPSDSIISYDRLVHLSG
jgi:hypothetical protein